MSAVSPVDGFRISKPCFITQKSEMGSQKWEMGSRK